MSKAKGILWIVAYTLWVVVSYIVSFIFGKKLGAVLVELF